MRSGRVGPCVAEQERKPASFPVIAASVFNRPRVERASRSNHQHVANVELIDHAAKLCAVGLGSARHFAEHLPAPCFLSAVT